MELLKSLCLGGVPPSELPHGSAKIIKLYLCNVGFGVSGYYLNLNYF